VNGNGWGGEGVDNIGSGWGGGWWVMEWVGRG
jgi:hypothetical protein